MKSILEAGFVFWGLFLVFGLIVAGYLIWMFRVEKAETETPLASSPNHESSGGEAS